MTNVTMSNEALAEMVAWATECIESDHAFGLEGEQISVRRAVVYVERNYPGGLAAAAEEFTIVANTARV